jgi:hypothetical protein
MTNTNGTKKVNVPVRPLSVIAREVRQNWKKSVSGTDLNFAARPYLSAMECLNKISDAYGMDSGKSIVAYFLSNASTWRGETAKRIKAELNVMLKSK